MTLSTRKALRELGLPDAVTLGDVKHDACAPSWARSIARILDDAFQLDGERDPVDIQNTLDVIAAALLLRRSTLALDRYLQEA